jgi:hypothetical protein
MQLSSLQDLARIRLAPARSWPKKLPALQTLVSSARFNKNHNFFVSPILLALAHRAHFSNRPEPVRSALAADHRTFVARGVQR